MHENVHMVHTISRLRPSHHPCSIIPPTMRVVFVVVVASLVALAAAAPCRQAWMVIPRGGASDYGSELEIVKSSVLDRASESV